VAEHGSASVSGAAECAGGYGLDAIEKLEGGAGGEKPDGAADYGFVWRVQTRDVVRKNQQENAGAGHKGGANDDGGIAGVGCAYGIFTSNGLAYANGSGGGNSQWDHVGERNGG
jgi:hypothetical protein